jgi:hypothetical protein
MAYLYLESIACIDQSEISEDEPYLLVNGRQVWEGDMSQGEAVNFQSEDPNGANYIDPIPFGRSATMALWEDDGDHWYDRNDYLGEKVAYSWQGSEENVTVRFTDDGTYSLTYAVA